MIFNNLEHAGLPPGHDWSRFKVGAERYASFPEGPWLLLSHEPQELHREGYFNVEADTDFSASAERVRVQGSRW